MVETLIKLRLIAVVVLAMFLLAVAQHHLGSVDESFGGRIGAGLAGGSALIGAFVTGLLAIPLVVAMTRKTTAGRLDWSHTSALFCAFPSGLAVLIMPCPLAYLAIAALVFDLTLAALSSYASHAWERSLGSV